VRTAGVILLIALTACGRLSFDALGDAANTPGDGDGSMPDGASARCDPMAPFTSVGPITELNSALDGAVRVSRDELTAYFHSNRGGSLYEIWTAQRADRTQPFGTPTRVTTGINTYWPTVSDNGLTLVDDDGSDLYVGSRGDQQSPFGFNTKIPTISTGSNESTPFLGSLGTLYFARLVGDTGIYSSPWPNPNVGVLVAGIDTTGEERAPVLSRDELIMYFARANPSPEHIYVATRPDRGSPFGTATQVAEVSSAFADAPTWLSPDLCRLYFESARSGGYDVYLAERTP
jgi:hypothetical protein